MAHGHYHPETAKNTSFIASLENKFFYLDQMKPKLPRDVVWIFGSTRYLEDTNFDDYNNPHFIINSDMTAAVGRADNNKFEQMKLYDGIFAGQQDLTDISSYPGFPSGVPRALQNASISLDEVRPVPQYGRLWSYPY
ncbi:MAG: hypothetical protein HRT45_08915 [Bdellovibrionales bacterium]|nr:hypothetical protein [Bdellovibrionales bacterium]